MILPGMGFSVTTVSLIYLAARADSQAHRRNICELDQGMIVGRDHAPEHHLAFALIHVKLVFLADLKHQTRSIVGCDSPAFLRPKSKTGPEGGPRSCQGSQIGST